MALNKLAMFDAARELAAAAAVFKLGDGGAPLPLFVGIGGICPGDGLGQK